VRALCYERHGDPRDGVVKNVFDPRPGPGQLVVRVVAAALNPADWKIVEGKFPFLLLPKTPFVPGCEAAGIVEAMDARVSGFRAGDEVIVSTGLRGALAEKVAVSALQVARKPANLSFEEAAAIPAAGQTALQALCDVAGVKAGQRLLVNGAGGGIGTFAVQVGKLLGAHVTAVASAGKHEILSGLGADALLDYRKDDFTRARQEWDVARRRAEQELRGMLPGPFPRGRLRHDASGRGAALRISRGLVPGAVRIPEAVPLGDPEAPRSGPRPARGLGGRGEAEARRRQGRPPRPGGLGPIRPLGRARDGKDRREGRVSRFVVAPPPRVETPRASPSPVSSTPR
jgi:hypothetical protein